VKVGKMRPANLPVRQPPEMAQAAEMRARPRHHSRERTSPATRAPVSERQNERESATAAGSRIRACRRPRCLRQQTSPLRVATNQRSEGVRGEVRPFRAG